MKNNTLIIKELKGYNNDWWLDQNLEESFSYFDLNSLYDETYFQHDHVDEHLAIRMGEKMKEFYQKITNNELKNTFELGCGGGWTINGLRKSGLDSSGVEGTNAGYNMCVNRGLGEYVKQQDLRLPFSSDKKYDMVVCTEVAEHIEIPFTSVLISNCINHSDIIWFSYNPNSNHSHHCNGRPEKFWINLFGFFNYSHLKPNEKYKEEFTHRLDLIFYNKSVFGDLDENLIINL
jgi:hypothetical protein